MKILTTFARSQNSNNYYDTHMRILYLERDPRRFFSRGGYNVLINNTLHNKSDVVTDAACFRIRRSEIN